MKKFFRGISFYILIFIVLIFLAKVYGVADRDVVDFKYSELVQRLQNEEVKEINIIENSIRGRLKNGQEFTSFVPLTDRGKFMENYINPLMEEGKIEVVGQPKAEPSVWLTLITPIFFAILLVVFFFFFMNQSQGGGNRVMSFGKSRAKMYNEDKRKVTFEDVQGADEEKEELKEIVDFLKHPKKFIELGARIPKGVLLVGPPGTGKTLISRAVAGEAGVPFFSISGSDFVEMFVGVGASRVRDLFEQAKKNSPCIIFIDEIDAVGRHRGAGLGGGHDEREQTLNQLLVEMDGFGINEGIIIIAATNRADILDPALLRPGRFDRHIYVGRPDIKGRENILKVHTKTKPLGDDVELSVLARRTPGFTGADLENLVNEAALLSARKNKRKITMDEMEEAITRVIAGPEKKSRVISEKERKLTAYHEAGHAVVASLLPNSDPVHQVSIIPRGRSGGHTLILPREDRYYMSKTEMEEMLVHLLGGRVAEKLVLNDISTGAQNDIERATSLARKMVTEYGMSEALGTMTFGSGHDEVFIGKDLNRSRNYSEEVAAAIDREIRKIIDTAYNKAEELLKNNTSKLEAVAIALLDKETLTAEEFVEVFKNS